jgi:hypothetical protein
MATKTPTNFVRRGGSGFTIFTFGGQPIAFCQEVAHTAPRPVGQGASAIQPMDEPYPIEILTPAAAGMGQITLNLFELFGSGGKASKVWDRLGMGANLIGQPPFGALNGANQNQGDASQFSNLNGNNFLAGAVDIVDIFIRQASQQPQATSVVQIIRPPLLPNGGGGNGQAYFLQYVGCVITDVQDGEQVNVGTLEIIKQLTIAYRYSLRDGLASAAFTQRDNMLGTGGVVGLG